MRRSIFRNMAVAMLLVLCLGTVGEAANTRILVHVLEFLEPGRQYFLDVVKPAFEKAYPGCEVELEFGGWSGRRGKLATRFAGGAPPDVMQFGAEDLGWLVANGMAAPKQLLEEAARVVNQKLEELRRK